MFEESLECVVGGSGPGQGPLGVGHPASAEAAGGTPGVRTPGLAASPLRASQAHAEGTRSRGGSKDQSSSPTPAAACLRLLSGRAGAGSGDTEHMALGLGSDRPTQSPGKLRGP